MHYAIMGFEQLSTHALSVMQNSKDENVFIVEICLTYKSDKVNIESFVFLTKICKQ